MYTLCTHHNHHYNSELIQPGQGVTANTYCTLMWCPHTHAHIQMTTITRSRCTLSTLLFYIMPAEQQTGLVTGSTVRYYSPHALAAWLHGYTLYICHGWNNLVHSGQLRQGCLYSAASSLISLYQLITCL